MCYSDSFDFIFTEVDSEQLVTQHIAVLGGKMSKFLYEVAKKMGLTSEELVKIIKENPSFNIRTPSHFSSLTKSQISSVQNQLLKKKITGQIFIKTKKLFTFQEVIEGKVPEKSTIQEFFSSFDSYKQGSRKQANIQKSTIQNCLNIFDSSTENFYQTREKNYQTELLGKQNIPIDSNKHEEIVLLLQNFRVQRLMPFAKKTAQLLNNKDSLNRYFTQRVLCEHFFQRSKSRQKEDIIKSLEKIGSFPISDDWKQELQEIANKAKEFHKIIAADKSTRGYFTFVIEEYFSSKLHEANQQSPNEKGAFVLFTLFPGYFTLHPRKHWLKPLVFTELRAEPVVSSKQRRNYR